MQKVAEKPSDVAKPMVAEVRLIHVDKPADVAKMLVAEMHPTAVDKPTIDEGVCAQPKETAKKRPAASDPAGSKEERPHPKKKQL